METRAHLVRTKTVLMLLLFYAVAFIRVFSQGKAYGQMLLDLKLKGLPDLKSLVD